ncbi:restriction endonuclease subunit S [Ligilactobacillus ruminis]|uniref:restriction endonuclease subunit S n=1 Tax=Ligilactobacillus ruminis TaxID=1623 RepID=UPI0013014BBB|nr:restriction endonuclease subunit S [Ligilactobacillus ruminis]
MDKYKKTKTAQAGDLIMSVRAPVGAMGKTAYDIVIGRGVAAIKGNEFIYQTLVKYDADRYWKKLAAGSTFESVNSNEVKGAIINVPQDIEEQKKIGEYFLNLDHLITLNQQKITLLTKLKKAMLEKMFPKKGSVIPEIRFNGFANAWEQQKLGEVFETVTDYVAAGSFADLAENVVYRDTPNYAQLVRTTDLKNGFHSGSNVYVDKKAFDFLYRVNLDKECIILPNIGNCGEVYLVIPDDLPYKHNVLGPNAILIRSDTSDNVFLSILLQGKDFQEKLSLIISPNGQTKFNKTELKQISLNMPKQSDEQHQLGAYFSQLDRLITLHRSKIDKIKNMKKAMLDQMFIQ